MRHPARGREDVALLLGLLVLAAVLSPWFDALSDRSLTWHMVQHVGIMMVAAPLLMLGAPLRRIFASLPTPVARRFSALLHHPVVATFDSPLVGWLALPVSLYLTHFSPIYEAALDEGIVHALEHGLYLGAALLFWNYALAVAPSPRALPYPARIFYVFVAMPVSAFLALAIYTSSHPLYPHYERALGTSGALLDQAYGAEFMWVATGFVMVAVFMSLVARWIRDEDRKTLLTDQRSPSTLR